MYAGCHHAEFGHTADTGNEIEGQEDHIDERQVSEQDVHVVVDDVTPRIHETGENRRVDLSLAATLLMLDANIVDHLELIFGESKFVGICTKPCQDR